MPHALLLPPLTPAPELASVLHAQGFAVADRASVSALCACPLPVLDALISGWDSLPPDNYLKDGGHYRRRRHSCFVVDQGQVEQVPHRAHWQPVEYNALHGGMQRLFEPMLPSSLAQPAWASVMGAVGTICSGVKPVTRWYVEAHQFRIDTTDGIGRPTPEGAHRDGVDFVAVFLINRQGIKGGETRVFEADGPKGQRFTLTEPWSLLLIDDERVIHESTPIQPTGEGGYRDTLVLTYRAAGFQGEA